MKHKPNPVLSITRQFEAYGFNGFVAATETYLKVLDPLSAEHVILKFLLANAVGQENAKCWPTIAPYLRARKIQMTQKQFQTSLLQQSRRSLFYIGSSQAGYFIFACQSDIDATMEFYRGRISKEEQHLEALQFLSSKANFPLPEIDRIEEGPSDSPPAEIEEPPSETMPEN